MTLAILAGLGLAAIPALGIAGTRNAVSLPSHLKQVGDDVYAIGTRRDPQSGRLVQGYAIIHRQDQFQKPSNPGGGHNGGGDTTSTCYVYLAKGAKWKTVEDWVMNPTNSRGLNENTLFTLESGALAKWEDAADGVVGNNSGANIFGNGTTDLGLTVDLNTLNGENEIVFGDIAQNGVIAVTNVWGVWGGPPSGREIVEWDQVYDDVSFDWSTTGAAGKMDFDNIATHEVGHAAGMGHPSSTCTLETMYAYADYGETLKRDLHDGDITGINGLY